MAIHLLQGQILCEYWFHWFKWNLIKMVFVQGNETLNRLGSRKNNAQYVLVTLWTLKRIKKETKSKVHTPKWKVTKHTFIHKDRQYIMKAQANVTYFLGDERRALPTFPCPCHQWQSEVHGKQGPRDNHQCCSFKCNNHLGGSIYSCLRWWD